MATLQLQPHLATLQYGLFAELRKDPAKRLPGSVTPGVIGPGNAYSGQGGQAVLVPVPAPSVPAAQAAQRVGANVVDPRVSLSSFWVITLRLATGCGSLQRATESQHNEHKNPGGLLH